MLIFLIIVLSIILAVYLFMQQAKFGQAPSGERLARIQLSSNYKEGKFENESFTPNLAEGVSYFTVIKDFFFKKSDRNKPVDTIPSLKTDLKAIDPTKDVLIWFGHSSYFIQVDGVKILVDPVFSGSASPIRSTTPSFPGSDAYAPDDFPAIDYLFLSHDHWDHLDYDTIIRLRPKIKRVITGLGVGAHLERWGYPNEMIIEKNWNEEFNLGNGFKVNTTPGRHFSGRGFKRNGSVWLSFVLTTPTQKIFLGGDSGYDSHFARIGNEHGPFDLVILECGQYNPYWKYIHMLPEETIQAAVDLKAKNLLPVHWSKFALAPHAWDEPIIRATAEAKIRNMPIIHPRIGEEVPLKGTFQSIAWWEKIK